MSLVGAKPLNRSIDRITIEEQDIRISEFHTRFPRDSCLYNSGIFTHTLDTKPEEAILCAKT